MEVKKRHYLRGKFLGKVIIIVLIRSRVALQGAMSLHVKRPRKS